MTSDDVFGRDLSRWLQAEGEHRVPDHLAEVLVATVATRQRPWWSSPERWLPMDTVAPRSMGNLRPSVALLVIVALLLALVGVAYVASRPPATYFGLAGNGRLFVADGTALKSYAADGSDPTVVRTLPAEGSDISLSPDGSRLATVVHDTPERIEVADLDGSDVVRMPAPDGTVAIGSAVTWSPDGRRVAYLTFDGTQEHLIVANADGTGMQELPVGPLDPTQGLWTPVWSPDGAWLAFTIADRDTGSGTISIVRPDGTDLHEVSRAVVSGGDGITWSPDPKVHYLLYRRAGGGSFLFDLDAKRETLVNEGFWPTWSPDGSKISVWGTKVASTADVLARRGARAWTQVVTAWSGSCQDHPELTGQSFCGPASWSPDGTRLYAPDITGDYLLSIMADGSGQPIKIRLDHNILSVGTPAVWQPVRR